MSSCVPKLMVLQVRPLVIKCCQIEEKNEITVQIYVYHNIIVNKQAIYCYGETNLFIT